MRRVRRPPKSRKLILDSFKSAYITVAFGHKTVKRKEPTPEGYDHDWEVYVRGYDKVHLDEIVQKVVFNIHNSYTKPRRVVKKPPYKVKESGYGGFHMLINVYFKCNDVEHQEYKIQYDLTYPEDNKSIENRTIKRISFTMPNESFLSKLMKAGATVEDTDSKIFANRLKGMKTSKDEIKNHDKFTLPNEGQKKGITQTKQEKVRVKTSKLEYAVEQKSKLKKKKLNLTDYHETGNDTLLEHRSKHALNSTSKGDTTLKGMKRTTNVASGAERKSVKLYNDALSSLITQSKDCSSDSELEDNITKNSASNRLTIDKKYNGTAYNKKRSGKKGSEKSLPKNNLLSDIYDSESDQGIEIDGAGSANTFSDQLLTSYNVNNCDNNDVKTGIHEGHISQYATPSSLNSQKSSNSSSAEKDLIIPTDHARFTKLQRIIVALDDDELINEIADIVYATGSYQICKESQKFQFKLEDLSLKALCRIEKLVYKYD